MVALVAALVACSPATDDDRYPFENVDDDANKNNVDNTTKEEAVAMTTDSINNLKEYVNTTVISDVGYYMEMDFNINTDNGKNFRFKLRANLYSYPYQDKEEGTPEYIAALNKHNEVCKKSDLLIEWYDGQENELLIGFYYDGVNSSVTDPGNKLYLNIQGNKRYYNNFGDTVVFRQIIRLITQFDLDAILAANESDIDDTIDIFGSYLDQIITTNYKVTKNSDVTSVYYDSVNFNVIVGDINSFVRAIFSPFEDKIDPLTDEYLRFKFSALAGAEIRTLVSDMRFLSSPDAAGAKNVLTGFEGDFSGIANSNDETVPFRAEINLGYSARVSDEISFSKDGYTLFEHGEYELEGDLYIPILGSSGNSTLDLRILTSLNEYDNLTNRIDARFYDRATEEEMLMAFYENELLYINTQGFSDRYGGFISISDVGFPTVYIPDIDMAELMKWFYDTVNNGVVSIVDTLLDPETYKNDAPDEGLIKAIMRKVESDTDEGTITVTVDHELLKDVLKYTQEVDPDAEVPLDKNGNPIYSLDSEGRPIYTTSGLVYMLESFIGYDLDEIASILGIQSAEKLLEYTWFEVTYNVQTGVITLEMYSSVRKTRSLVFRINLWCITFAQKVTFPDDHDGFDGYTELKSVKTLSGKIQGDIKFNSSDRVDLSALLGTMIGDRHGLNTVYLTRPTSAIDFYLIMDQYIQYSEDDENLNEIISSITNEGVYVDYADLANETRGRIAFYFTLTVKLGNEEDLVAKLYAYNVSFNTETYKKIENGESIEGYGYVYVDLTGGKTPALNNVPPVKIREDVFLESLSTYLGANEAIENASTLSIASIIAALLEDSTTSITDTYLGVTTSNSTVRKLFGVDDLVAHFKLNIGLKAQVVGQYNLYSTTDEYYDYTVGQLEDMTVESIYDADNPIHTGVYVTFKREKDGVEKSLLMKFAYYRRVEPVRGDYETDEEYERALEDYRAYVESEHNIDLVEGKSVYYPAIDGPFMGADRSYTLTVKGSNQLVATSIITGLVKTEFEWEPLEDKPSTIECSNARGTNVYSAYYDIDFDSITIEGRIAEYYDVIIGKGSLGEFSARVKITVRNRLITDSDGNVAPTVTVLTSDGYRSASVTATYSINPYEYILARSRNEIYKDGRDGFISVYLSGSTVTLNFADGSYITQAFSDWKFDEGEEGFYLEKGISPDGGVVYVHSTFKNQVIALKLEIMTMKVSHVSFEGEDPGEYTVDVLDTATWTIPTTPTIHFVDEDGQPTYSMTSPFSLVWSASVASNVRLDGAKKNEAGVECPFPDFVGNEISAYFDVYSALGVGEWFRAEIVTLKVEVPAKSFIEYGTATVYTDATLSATEDIDVIGVDMYSDSTLYADYNGYYFYDYLYPETTGELPDTVLARFKDGTSKSYRVNWIESDIVTRRGDSYVVSSAASLNMGKLFRIESSIGEGEAEYKFSIVLVILPAYSTADSVEFSSSDGELDSSAISGNDKTYTYYVNAFDTDFILPDGVTFNYADSLVIGKDLSGIDRIYRPFYSVSPQAIDGSIGYKYVLGSSSEGGLLVPITLNVSTGAFVVKGLSLTVGDGDIVSRDYAGVETALSITISDTDRTIFITGLNIDSEGRFRYSIGSDNYDDDVVSFIEWLLTSGTELRYIEGGSEKTSRYSTLVDFRKGFSVQNLSGSGQNTTLRLSVVPGVLDYIVNIRGSAQSVVTDVDKTYTLTQYAADGSEVYKSEFGYDLSEYKLSVRVGTQTVVYENLAWYVDSTSDGIYGDYKTGERVSFITRDTIYGKHSLEQRVSLYTHLPDGTRASLEIRIPALDWTDFDSLDSYDGELVISGGEIIVDNMYDLSSTDIDSVMRALPTSVRFRNLVASDVVWNRTSTAEEYLQALRYDTETSFVLATATVDVVGELDIELKITFRACVPSDIISMDVDGVTSDFDAVSLINNVTINPYKTTTLNGKFGLPENITIELSSGRREEIKGAEYYSDGSKIDRVAFDYHGKTVEAVTDLGYGLTIKTVVTVIDSVIGTMDVSQIVDGETVTPSAIKYGKIYSGNVLRIGDEEYSFDSIDGHNVLYGNAVGTIDYSNNSKVSLNGTDYALSDIEVGNRTLIVGGEEYYFFYDTIYEIIGNFDEHSYRIGTRTGSMDDAEIRRRGYYDITAATTPTGGVYIIDPYSAPAEIDGEETYLPTVIVADIGGEPISLRVEWSETITVNYQGSNMLKLVGRIVTAGLDEQEIVALVSVRNRESVSIGLWDEGRMTVYTPIDGQNYKLYVEDTFSYNATDLPQYAVVDGEVVSVIWNAGASDFSAAGGTSIVNGYAVGASIGHVLSLSVVADTYTFRNIWRPTDTTGDDYTSWSYDSLMSPIGFTFVNLTGEKGAYYVGYRAYKVTFVVKNNNPDREEDGVKVGVGATRLETRYFVPSGYATEGDNVISFDNSVVLNAESTSSEQTGAFYLGGTGKTSLVVSGATYRVREPLLSESDLTYLYITAGGERESSYILIDPLNPSVPEYAYAYTNWSEAEKVRFRITDSTALDSVNYDSYLSGGVLLGKYFTFSLVDDDGELVLNKDGETVSLSARVRILFLDRRADSKVETAMSITTEDGEEYQYVSYDVTFVSTYLDGTYLSSNPYGTLYSSDGGEIINALNLAIDVYGAAASLTVKYDNGLLDARGAFLSFTVSGKTRKYSINIL